MRPNSSNSGLRSCSSKPRGICPTKSLMASWSFMGTAGPGFSPPMLTPLSAVLKPRRGPGPTGGADPPGAAAISPPRQPSPGSPTGPAVPSLDPWQGPIGRGRGPGGGKAGGCTEGGVPSLEEYRGWGRLERGGPVGVAGPDRAGGTLGSGLKSPRGALWAPSRALPEPSPELQTPCLMTSGSWPRSLRK